MPRVAVYARVSTQEQTVDSQLHALREYSRARGLEVVGEFVDHGVSGAKDQRPALDQLLKAARRRRFDAVACVKLDRLARSVRHLTTLAGDFEALGIGLIVLDQAIDTTTPSGRLLFHVLGAIAEFERDLIRERTAAGVRAARRRGKRIGRPRVQISRSEVLLGVEAGEGVATVARRLGVSRTVIRRVLAEMGLSKRVSAGTGEIAQDSGVGAIV
jgi:DNA invertase Pin-like site-specific DNA recombinase